MPGSTKKDLYIANSMGQLNEFAELPAKVKTTNAKLLVKTADKMLKEAHHSDMVNDEERAYVLFMKYFNVVTFLKKTADYKKQKTFFDDLLGAKNIMTAIDKAESLSKSLKSRYDLKEAEAVAKKLSSLDTEGPKVEEKKKSEDKQEEVPADTEATKEPQKSSGCLSSTQLFSLLGDPDAQVILMDVRPIADYLESRINNKNIINVPAEAIKPGTTVTYIEKAMPMDSLSLWKQRGNIDHIVLLDWNTSYSQVTIGSPLQTLKDALFKYDSTVIIRSEPLILDGGYEQWLLHYPTLCINPDFQKLSRPTVISSQAQLMDFDYPDFDEMIKPPEPEPRPESRPEVTQGSRLQNGDLSSPYNNGGGGSLPRIDRSTKPKVDRSTKNAISTEVKAPVHSSSNSLYPDVGALSAGVPANQNRGLSSSSGQTANQNKVLTNSDVNRGGSARAYGNDAANNSDLNKVAANISLELSDLDKRKKQKKEELDNLEREHERIRQESLARLEKMKEEEEKLNKLEELRRQQQTDVADLMRLKKNIQQNMDEEKRKIEKEAQRDEMEEGKRKEELDRIAREEEKKKQRQEEVNRMRLERKKKDEEKQAEIDRQEKEERALREAGERARQEDEARQRDQEAADKRAQTLRQEEADRKSKEEAEKLKERAAIEERIRQEKERQKKLEEERQAEYEEKRRQQAEADRREREKQEALRSEREKQEQERLEREKQEREERDRKKAEEAKRLADEKLRLLNESKSKPKVVPSPHLQQGWEKQLDPRTNRYFYINHNNNTTQWEPPPHLVSGGKAGEGTYTTKLKEEPGEKRRGLSRSNSSPNIAQMIEDEDKKPLKQLPSINRAVKPVKKLETRVPVTMPAKRRDLNPTYGNVGRALTGLRNLGNTCYMNSTIQCLNNTSPLVTYLISDMYLYDINRENTMGDQGEVADDFAYVVKALWSGQYRFITPRDFKFVVGKHQPMFAGYDQQDSQEFLTFLLDGLHEGLNKVKTRPKIPDQDNDRIPDIMAAELAWKNHKLQNESIIVELFQGQLKSTLTCQSCGRQSVTFQAFMFLSLPIPSASRCTLNDCLNQFAAKEMMTGSSRWKCPQCKCLRDSIKKIEIWKLPRILLIALNRFVYEGQWRTKINAYVDFPTRNMDLSAYVKGPGSKPYKLYAVSNHFGTLDGGHYTACCRNPCTQKWNKFDDHEVYDISESSVKTSAAYVLYYTSIELPPPDFRMNFG